MECKDCIHYDVCQYHITEETKMTVAECSNFKDKSKFIKLPCKVGDKVYCVYEHECCHLQDAHKECDRYSWDYDDDVCEGCEHQYFDPYIMSLKFDLAHIEQIGKNIFLTKEEAEKSIKGA